MFTSQIRDFERIANDNDNRKAHAEVYNNFIESIKKHDYSYMMSDSHKVWENGNAEEKRIQSLIKSMIDSGTSASYLLSVALNEVKQQYTDVDVNGDDLTHRVIKGWFIKFLN